MVSISGRLGPGEYNLGNNPPWGFGCTAPLICTITIKFLFYYYCLKVIQNNTDFKLNYGAVMEEITLNYLKYNIGGKTGLLCSHSLLLIPNHAVKTTNKQY